MERNTENEIFCNCCGKKIYMEKGIIKQGVLPVNADWGYFSGKDGEIHQFLICEDCYDEWIKGFKIPINIVRKTELI